MREARNIRDPRSVFNFYMFVLGERIAQGAHGAIFRTEIQQGDITKHAVVKQLFKQSDTSDEVPFQFQTQRKLTEKFHTSDESGLLDLYVIHKTPEKIYLAVMPECEFTLHQAMPVILNLSKKTDLESKRFYHRILFGFFSSMVRALTTLHEAKIVHCDIKPQNIGLSPDDNSEGQVKWVLFDYSSAKHALDKDQDMILRGTLKYMAPESVTENQHTVSSDIWSFSCILIEMMRLATDDIDYDQGVLPEVQLTLKHIETLKLEKKQLMQDPKGQKYLKIARLQDSPLPEQSKFLLDKKGKDKADEFKKNICGEVDFLSCLKIAVNNMHQSLDALRVTLPLLITAMIQLQKHIPVVRESKNDRTTFQSKVRLHLMQAKKEKFFSSRDFCNLTIQSDEVSRIPSLASSSASLH